MNLEFTLWHYFLSQFILSFRLTIGDLNSYTRTHVFSICLNLWKEKSSIFEVVMNSLDVGAQKRKEQGVPQNEALNSKRGQVPTLQPKLKTWFSLINVNP